ncbi:MAG: host specificity factor TipJ family phage tail protein, partial [Treponema sp.]|nr:host specificity factor TipJ family phage tail protein [Treponema sp.]
TYQLLGYFNNGSNTISGAELKTKRYQITKEGLIPGKYDVKIERTTADSTDSKVVDTVHLGSIRSIKQVRPIRADRQKDLTIIALRVTATARLNNVLDTFNYVAVSKLPVYSNNGSGSLYWLNTAVTQNPASMLLYALRGKAAQQQVEPDNIDWQSFEAFYLWCEEHDYKCNAYISESVTIAELMRMIGNTARADILRIDSKISVVQDIERPGPVQLFTPKNTISYSITMFNADTPDQIALRYIDEDAGFIHNEVQVYNTPDGNRGDKPPNTIQKVDLWGITNNKQARRIGMYNYACIKNRPFFHTIDVDIEYLLCNKGDCVHYAGDIALTGSVQGRIKGIIWVDGVCVGIDTDEPVPMAEGHLYAVRIRLSNGTIILKEVVFNPGIRREKSFTYYPVDDGEDLYEPFIGDMYAVDEDNVIYEPFNVILFTEPLDANNVPKAGDIYAFGVRGYEVVELIITDIQPGQNFTATLSCVEHSPEIFDVDKPDFVLPDFINRITPVSGAIDDGVINPVNWQRFSLFHDSEDEPHRPSSDWQNEGWYQSQNFRSIWQSSKLAEIIESGEWSLPVRIKSYRGTDDITPIWLGLTPQNITLETDGDGNIQTGLFPITIQARLLQWNSLLSDVIYSLPDNKAGISIDSNGVITVNKNADLDDNNNIRVNAEYNGTVYTSVINIKKNIRNSPARYLGTVTELQLTSTVTIIKGPQPGQVRALQGDYVLAVAAVKNQSAGSVFQWTGLAWEYRSPATHSDLYMRSFKDGLDVPELTKDMGWFGAVFAKMLVVMDAFIETLSAQKILLKNGGIIQSDNYDPVNKIGWMIDYLGNAVFNNATVRGHIDAESGSIRNLNIDNVTIGKEAVYLGIIKTGPVFISNETTAPIEPRVFAANTRIRDIVEALGPNATINVSTGYFGTIQGLKTVIVSLRSTGVFSYTYTISLIFNNSVPYEISDTGNISPPPTLGAVLSLGGSIPGKIFIMENLPIGSEGLQAGSVYRNGNQLMIV